MAPQPPPPPFDPMDVLGSPAPPAAKAGKISTAPDLSSCDYCGAEISGDMLKCRHCGEFVKERAPRERRREPAPPKKSSKWLVIGGLCAAVFAFVAIGGIANRMQNAAAAKYVPDEATQQARRELLAELEVKQIFTKTEMPGDVARAWVGPSFYLLSYEQKTAFCGVVYAYYYPNPRDPRTGNSVRLIDWRSGKTIGDFSASGLDLD